MFSILNFFIKMTLTNSKRLFKFTRLLLIILIIFYLLASVFTLLAASLVGFSGDTFSSFPAAAEVASVLPSVSVSGFLLFFGATVYMQTKFGNSLM